MRTKHLGTAKKNFNGFNRKYGRGYRSKVIVPKLRKRDGDLCFYCGLEVLEDNSETIMDYSPTVEHIVNNMHGGPNKMANYVLAHHKCNQMAGSMAAIDKIKLRDEMRGRL